ncbi:SET domain-containing protein 3 [Collariella sp. IMI 366227]|nr:SET domain-containing protein 3 [Collariella sp. IMI 366227]
MTDKLPPLSTPLALPSQSTVSLSGPISARDAPRKPEADEEEPYTIKCICNFAGDDGNTILCETCDTWQHIGCYYPDNSDDVIRDDFVHSCVDCQPRYVDRQRAIQRQKARTAVLPVEEAADKKPKRPPSKSHKKKPKPSDLQINSAQPGASESTKHISHQDNPHPPKKTKNSHKPSQSVSSQAPKRSPSHGTAKLAQPTPLSPATTPPDLPDDFELHNYSSGFLSLYNEQAFQIVNTNSFSDLRVSNTMAAWLRDPAKMQQETGLTYSDVFQKLPSNMDALRATPEIELAKKVIPPGTVMQWQCLRASTAIEKDVPLMEVNGQVGFQAMYCADPEHRWSELSAPLPFVLFHPLLPLYIDTRREGSEARFVRRSCRPNAVLETYLSGGGGYHFWLVSDRRIAAKEQITIPWDFRFPTAEKTHALRVLGLGDDMASVDTEPTVEESDYQKYGGWVHLILSEHGGCACNLGPECAFARFHRNYLAKSQPRVNLPKSKKRKPKAQHAISPTSTGHATNSRAPSEGHLEDIPEHDRRSVSSTSRSKPPSRDMTPTARQGSFDTLGILTEPTDRDKRKVAMVEDTFRRMEQQQQQPQRKRKRVSDGSSVSQAKVSKTSSAAQTPNFTHGFDRGYVDAGTETSRNKSRSPSGVSPTHHKSPQENPGSRTGSVSARSRHASVGPLPSYCDAAVQTDFPETIDTTTPRRKVGSCLRKRMLENWHHLRLEEEERVKRRALERTPSVTMDIDSPADQAKLLASPASTREAETAGPDLSVAREPKDHPMPDARSVSPTNTTRQSPTPVIAIKDKTINLSVQMPLVPILEQPASATPSTSTPVSAGPAAIQSPFSAISLTSPFGPPSINGVVATPSPIKKKLSLSDYKHRMNKAAAARPPVGTTLLKPASGSDEPKSATSIEGEPKNSPIAEKVSETTGPGAPSTTTTATSSTPSGAV